MKRYFEEDGYTVEISTCTAIAASIGGTTRQPALFVRNERFEDIGEADSVVFGYPMPGEDQDISDWFEQVGEDSARSTYHEDLESVEVD